MQAAQPNSRSDGIISLSSTLVVSNSVMLDGSGHNVTISGEECPGFPVITDASLTLSHLTIANGKATNGAGIYNDGGTVTLLGLHRLQQHRYKY